MRDYWGEFGKVGQIAEKMGDVDKAIASYKAASNLENLERALALAVKHNKKEEIKELRELIEREKKRKKEDEEKLNDSLAEGALYAASAAVGIAAGLGGKS